ncbi:MAG: hypothetical protein PHH14_08030, partial [Candidatus Margulisbacteria bacterium]|nr:hypothetical protein [Candidatus Margulisiibacteriota bacterium]
MGGVPRPNNDPGIWRTSYAYWQKILTNKTVDPNKVSLADAMIGTFLVPLDLLLAGSPAGCTSQPSSSDQSVNEELEEGIPGTQPSLDDYPEEATTTSISGNNDPTDDPTCVDLNQNGVCGEIDDNLILAIDNNGNPILSDEAFFDNTTVRYLGGTPIIPFSWSFKGNYADVNWRDDVEISLGLNTTLLPGMPDNAEPLPGLVTADQATQEEVDNDFSCQEPGYEAFLNCPQYESNQVPVYLASYTIRAYDENGALIGEQTVINIDLINEAGANDFFSNPSNYSAYQLPATGGLPITIPGDGNDGFNNAREIK